ncbi:MAG: hypothetical protein K6F51_10660 [Acetatifactor sp.]|nr:hypothetical protein [Acetatifactor sp.]
MRPEEDLRAWNRKEGFRPWDWKKTYGRETGRKVLGRASGGDLETIYRRVKENRE